MGICAPLATGHWGPRRCRRSRRCRVRRGRRPRLGPGFFLFFFSSVVVGLKHWPSQSKTWRPNLAWSGEAQAVRWWAALALARVEVTDGRAGRGRGPRGDCRRCRRSRRGPGPGSRCGRSWSCGTIRRPRARSRRRSTGGVSDRRGGSRDRGCRGRQRRHWASTNDLRLWASPGTGPCGRLWPPAGVWRSTYDR